MIPRRAPDPEPVPQCGATFNEHRCTLDKDHEGWHQEWVERLVDTATWQDAPEPVPEWREWVTAQHDEVVGSRASALEDVLMCLSEVERGASKNYALARIVARCEREVGDGWQVDPAGELQTIGAEFSVLYLLSALTKSVPHPPDRWRILGNRAAAWLRDLCNDKS